MRKKSTRLLSAALAVCMMLSVLPVGAFAAEPGTEPENGNGVSAQETTAAQSEQTGDVAIDGTNFPDPIFREFVKQFDTSRDDTLSQSELAAVTELKCSKNSGTADDKKIKSLKGIEYFTSLKQLYCDWNQLTELDVSTNTALETLNCGGNQLTALNVSKNTELKGLYCDENPLTKLDVSSNRSLEYLSCIENQLTSLDLSHTKGSLYFKCYENSYTIAVDPKNQFDLKELPGDFDVSMASDWKNGHVDVIEGRYILTVDGGVDKVTYTYGCGRNLTADFTLCIPHRHTYGDWSHNDTDHWHECTNAACPDKAEHVYDDDADTTCNVCGYERTLTPAVPDAPAGGSGTGNIQGAISAVVVGAAAGAIIYEAGTGIYRVINMPGIPMPSNRIELAELLWERADKPEPVSTALYDDIDEDDTDAQKAARWAVEQDLMKDDSEKNTFNPYFPVGKLRTCLTWDTAKEKGLFAKTEE